MSKLNSIELTRLLYTGEFDVSPNPKPESILPDGTLLLSAKSLVSGIASKVLQPGEAVDVIIAASVTIPRGYYVLLAPYTPFSGTTPAKLDHTSPRDSLVATIANETRGELLIAPGVHVAQLALIRRDNALRITG